MLAEAKAYDVEVEYETTYDTEEEAKTGQEAAAKADVDTSALEDKLAQVGVQFESQSDTSPDAKDAIQEEAPAADTSDEGEKDEEKAADGAAGWGKTLST